MDRVTTDMSHDVKAVFDRFGEDQHEHALALRKEVLAIARAHPEIGPIDETLKWGEPAYLPAEKNTGSTCASPR